MKNIKTAKRLCKKIAVIALAVLTALSVSACARGVNQNGQGDMRVDVTEDGTVRNGTEYYTYRVEEGYSGTVSVNISKKSGKLDLDIYKVNSTDKPDYTGRDLDSATFSVVLSKAGEYRVRVTAKEFEGDYSISWKTEKQTQK